VAGGIYDLCNGDTVNAQIAALVAILAIAILCRARTLAFTSKISVIRHDEFAAGADGYAVSTALHPRWSLV
jgi:hypothetical protein